MLKPTYIETSSHKLEELTIDHNLPDFRQSSKSYNPHPQQLEFRGTSFVSLLRALDGRSLVYTPDLTPCVSPEVDNFFCPLVVKKQRRDREMALFDTLESSDNSNGMSPPMVNSTSPITPESSGIHSTIAGTTPYIQRKKPMLGRISVSSGGHPVGNLFMADIWQDDSDSPSVLNVVITDSGSTAVATPSPNKTVSPSDALDMMIRHGGRDARLYQDVGMASGMTTASTPKRHRDQWKAKWSDTKRHSKEFFKKAKRGRSGDGLSRSDYSGSVSSFQDGASNHTGDASASISGASGVSGTSETSGTSGASGAGSVTGDANGDLGVDFTDFTGTYSYKDMVTASEGTPRACHSDHFGSMDDDGDGGAAELTSSYERLFEKESLRTKFWKVFKKEV